MNFLCSNLPIIVQAQYMSTNTVNNINIPPCLIRYENNFPLIDFHRFRQLPNSINAFINFDIRNITR